MLSAPSSFATASAFASNLVKCGVPCSHKGPKLATAKAYKMLRPFSEYKYRRNYRSCFLRRWTEGLPIGLPVGGRRGRSRNVPTAVVEAGQASL